MTDSRVLIIFKSADGGEEYTRYYDTDDYASVVDSGEHDQIVDEIMPVARQVLGPGARLASVLVDGVEQSD